MGRRAANAVGSGSSRLIGADYVATDIDPPCVLIEAANQSGLLRALGA